MPSNSLNVRGSADSNSYSQLEKELWFTWLAAVLPDYCAYPFGPHHISFWEWVWEIEPHMRPDASINIWARGGAKSTSAEAACVALGARRKRNYGLYVCDIQDRADDHVGNVAAMMETPEIDFFYPEVGQRLLSKFGTSRGWRRNRIRTASGFTLDAIGLDSAARGVKLDDQRPDFIVIDDIDSENDSELVTAKKIRTLTKSIIPAGSSDVAILAIQNLIHRNGIFARMLDGRADFLTRRRLSGPIPALLDFTTSETGEIQGTPTWAGQDLATCQAMIEDMGLSAFLAECQHEIKQREGALWKPEMIDTYRVPTGDIGDLRRIIVGVDPAVSSNKNSDETGIVVAGIDSRGHVYVLLDRTVKGTPLEWAREALRAFDDTEADLIVGETNNGGELVEANLRQLRADVPFKSVHASRGKAIRAEPIVQLYERGEVHHVGYHAKLEEQMLDWIPTEDSKSPDRLDALVWAVTELKPASPPRRKLHFEQ